MTTGSVGIGTSSPSKKLHIVPSGSNAYDAVQIGDGLYLGNTSNNNNAALVHQGGGADLEIGSQQHITFTTGNIAGSATERLRIDSSGRLLLGTTTEGEATADNLTIADSGHCGITLRSGTSSVGTIFFSDATSGTAEYQGYVQYDHSGNYLKWATAATVRMRIDSSGNLTAYSGSTNGNYFVIRGKHSPGNDFNRSEVRFGVENNASGLGFLAFATGNNTAHERMRIDSSGNVGIGTSTINLTASGRKTLDLNGNSENAISFSHSNTLAAFLYTSSTEFRMQSEISVPLVFRPNNSEVMRLETSGRAKCTAGYLYVQNSVSGTGDTDGLALISDGNADKYVWNYENTSLRFGTNSQERMRIEGGGNTRLEIKSGLYLHHLNSGAGNSTLKYGTSSGLVSFDTSSRLVKEQIIDCPYGIDKLKQLQPRKYFRTDDQAVEIGFIADELVQVMPEFVPIGPKSVITKNENDTEEIPLGVNYEKLTSVLTKALQEAIAKIETLETQNASLEARLTALEGGS